MSNQKDLGQDIVDALAGGPLTAPELVQALNMGKTPKALIEPMKALQEAGYVTQDGATFAINPAAFEGQEEEDATANAFAQAQPVAQPAAKKAAQPKAQAQPAAKKAAVPQAQTEKKVGLHAVDDPVKGFTIAGFASLDRVSKGDLGADIAASQGMAQALWETGEEANIRAAVSLQRFINRARRRFDNM